LPNEDIRPMLTTTAGSATVTEPEPSSPAAGQAMPLAGLDLFAGVEPRTLEQLRAKLQRRTLGKRETLFSPGDEADALYLVVEGRVRIWTVSATGIEVTLNVLTAGAIFGEIAMLDGSVRTAGASSMTETKLISLARRPFFDALDRDPKLARNVIDLLCKRLRWTSARMEDATLRQAPERLARLLGHLAQDHGRQTAKGIEITIKLTQGELAQWTAMSRESLNKLLNRWIDRGVIHQDKGFLTVTDAEALEEIAEFGEGGA
jgi:CRP/FNR family transcriptional regulator, cyclic AMP receptor protein